MRGIWIVAFASLVAVSIAAFVVYMEVSTRAAPQSEVVDFFANERQPTHGGQQMQPRWGEN